MTAQRQQTAWHVATIRPGAGDAVYRRLEADGFEMWRPMHECWRFRRGSRTRELVHRPCIPAYLFVAVTPRIWGLQRISGVTGLIMVGSAPAVIPDRELDPMRERLGTGNGSSATVEFVKGEMLRLLSGSFAQFPAKFDNAERNGRIRVDVKCFGRSTSVVTHVADVERIG